MPHLPAGALRTLTALIIQDEMILRYIPLSEGEPGSAKAWGATGIFDSSNTILILPGSDSVSRAHIQPLQRMAQDTRKVALKDKLRLRHVSA